MKITIKDNFDLQKIVDSGQCFRAAKIDKNRFLFIHRNNVLLIRNWGSSSSYSVSCTKNQWEKIWFPYFNLEKNYSAIKPKSRDKYLQTATEFSNGIRILRQDPWETLVSFIISQRNSIPSISASIEKMCTMMGEKISIPKAVAAQIKELYSFPSPAQILAAGPHKLKKCKLGYRVPYVLDAAESVIAHKIDLDKARSLNDEQLLEYFCHIKGVGVKVANCVALFAYVRHDLAPVDTWIHKIIQTKYNGKNPFVGKDAGIMQQYAFYFARNMKNL